MENQTNQKKESLLEKAVGFVKDFFSEPWMYSSSEKGYLPPETRRRFYETMDRFYS